MRKNKKLKKTKSGRELEKRSPTSEFQKMDALIDKNNKKDVDPADAKALQDSLKSDTFFYRFLGNFQNQAFMRVFNDATAHSVALQKCSKKYLEEMKTELGYETSTFVEKMLIDEVIMRWLQLQTVGDQYHLQTRDDHTQSSGLYWDKRLTGAQRRFTRSFETLTRVRKMIAQTQAKGAKMFRDLMTK